MRADTDEDWSIDPNDPQVVQEAMSTICVAIDNWNLHVIKHLAVSGDPAVHQIAAKVTEAMYDTYRALTEAKVVASGVIDEDEWPDFVKECCRRNSSTRGVAPCYEQSDLARGVKYSPCDDCLAGHLIEEM